MGHGLPALPCPGPARLAPPRPASPRGQVGSRYLTSWSPAPSGPHEPGRQEREWRALQTVVRSQNLKKAEIGDLWETRRNVCERNFFSDLNTSGSETLSTWHLAPGLPGLPGLTWLISLILEVHPQPHEELCLCSGLRSNYSWTRVARRGGAGNISMHRTGK